MVRFGNPVERKGSQTQAKESEAHPPPLLGVPQKNIKLYNYNIYTEDIV